MMLEGINRVILLFVYNLYLYFTKNLAKALVLKLITNIILEYVECRECSVNAGQKRRICRVVKVSYFLKILHVGFL